MRLSKEIFSHIKTTIPLELPLPHVFELPEKVIQFGTGVFIRGLIDYYIDKANHQSVFNGRVVMVKSTDAGDIQDFRKQDCLYTLLMKSVTDGKEIDEKRICAAVSRVLDAKKEWADVLDCAANPAIQIVISNTTENGIVLLENDRVDNRPPASFPGKLLAYLLHRYKTFNGSAESGMVIVPTELIVDNGDKLKAILNELAEKNKLDKKFIEWLNTSNDFCNSLVDRIVPGKLPQNDHQKMERVLGYEDALMIMAETFGLWAIESSSSRTRAILSFSSTDEGIHIVNDILKFRELKLRLLNASHNLSCALGVVADFHTVKEAMTNRDFELFMERLILGDIAKAILSDRISPEDAAAFGSSVVDRYRNPYIEFEWLSICVQDTSKIKIRAVPVVLQHFQKYQFVPDHISLGFAAYILFMRSQKDETGTYTGEINGRTYTIFDDFAENLYSKWKQYSGLELVKQILKDKNLWDTDLDSLSGFSESVNYYLENLQKSGFPKTVKLRYHQSRSMA